MLKKDVKQLLAESFKKLVAEKQIEHITIKEITDGAGVIRVTFYNHFQDKYELLEWICREEVLEPAKVLIWDGMTHEALTFMFHHILNNRDFYSSAARVEGQNSFESIVKGFFSEIITDFLVSRAKGGKQKYPWLTPERAGEFYAQPLAYMLITWIKGGMQETPENMVAMYEYATAHSLMDLPDDF